ncbi:MAG TPA: DUF6220 domain-containing protein [Dehalococcoidia bacterium]|nr:DUF6220 domain-containing protein [Dehalococcoidia bacterium]
MSGTQVAYRWLVWLILLAVALQFFLAGLGVLGGESIDPHRGLGSLIELLTLILAILAFVSKQPKPVLWMCVTLFVLAILQSLFATEDLDPEWLRSFHVFDAFLIAGLAQHLAVRAGWPLSPKAS